MTSDWTAALSIAAVQLTQTLQRVLVNYAVLHDEPDRFRALGPWFRAEPLVTGAHDGEILQRITIDQQDIGIGTLLDDAELALRIGVCEITAECRDLASYRSQGDHRRVGAKEMVVQMLFIGDLDIARFD